jgi:hypothetical protein
MEKKQKISVHWVLLMVSYIWFILLAPLADKVKLHPFVWVLGGLLCISGCISLAYCLKGKNEELRRKKCGEENNDK